MADLGGSEIAIRPAIEEIGRFARRRGIRLVFVKTFSANTDALRFWEGLGFQPRGVQLVALAGSLGRDADRPG